MTPKERVDLYLSGTSGGDAERKLENALLEDDGLLELFMEECEASLEQVDLTKPVMRAVLRPPVTAVPLPGRKLRAAMCFCGAAAVIICTVFGPDRLAGVFTSGLPEKFYQLLSAIRALT